MTQAEFDAIRDELIQAYRDRKGAQTMTFFDQSVTFEHWSQIEEFLTSLRSQVDTPRYRLAKTRKGV